MIGITTYYCDACKEIVDKTDLEIISFKTYNDYNPKVYGLCVECRKKMGVDRIKDMLMQRE